MVLSIITLNYKKPELTIECLDSLWEQYKVKLQDNTIEVIIVDNDSQDDSVEKIKRAISEKKFHNMQVIANPSNAGFGTGCNLGAAKSKGEFILFLNNDTLVKDKGIMKMVEYCQNHQDVAVLGGQLRNLDGSLQASTGKFYTLWYAFLLLIGGQRFGFLDRSPDKIEKVDWVKGALLMIRRDVFERLHGFDEKIFMYTEDMELCYRVHQAGLEIYFYPDVQVLHQDHGSTSKTFAIVNIYKNLLYFYKKHRSLQEYQLLKLLLQTKAKSLIAAGKMTNNQYLIETYEKALAEI
jgi:hypothetical protein